MEFVYTGLIFIIGAMLGSAANALIDRLPRNESWVAGRSHCDKCGHQLEARDLVPIVSYLALGGKCRYCRAPIPYRNLVVEMFLGLAFVAVANYGNLSWGATAVVMGIVWVSVIIGVMDWQTKLVSEVMIVVWAVLVVAFQFASQGQIINYQSSVVGVVIGSVMIGGLWAVSRGRAMGFGDVEIAAVMGWWLGWPGVVVAIWAAFVSGAIIGGIKLAARSGKLQDEIAFGPFLILGAWVAFLWGERIIKALGYGVF